MFTTATNYIVNVLMEIDLLRGTIRKIYPGTRSDNETKRLSEVLKRGLKPILPVRKNDKI